MLLLIPLKLFSLCRIEFDERLFCFGFGDLNIPLILHYICVNLTQEKSVHGGHGFSNISIASKTFYSKNMNQEVCASCRTSLLIEFKSLSHVGSKFLHIVGS